jgi:hypothetical protein
LDVKLFMCLFVYCCTDASWLYMIVLCVLHVFCIVVYCFCYLFAKVFKIEDPNFPEPLPQYSICTFLIVHGSCCQPMYGRSTGFTCAEGQSVLSSMGIRLAEIQDTMDTNMACMHAWTGAVFAEELAVDRVRLASISAATPCNNEL